MSFKKDFNSELDSIFNKRDKVAKTFSIELNSTVVQATPVDHGDLKRAWTWSQIGEGHYRSSNNLEYAEIINGGRRMVNGKMQGSEQLQEGFDPIIDREIGKLEEMLKAIK